MRFRSCYIPTLKESPADAEVISHKLLVRAGMVRKLASGIYVYLPLALRSLRKIEGIIREEMATAHYEELLLPMVQPGELWKESGRWEHYGKELLRFKDRNDHDCCLGPTHEEVITDVIRGEVRSYRELPARPYQIQTKYRDEIRPRFGLMRGREFIMKDGYSFDRDEAGLDAAYWDTYNAYTRIFTRLGLRFRPVLADGGSIGGNYTHEFHVLAGAGEDTLCVCTKCGYAANVERAEVKYAGERRAEPCGDPEIVATPGRHTVAEVCEFLGIQPAQLVKTMIFLVDGGPVAVLVRGDREANDIKLKNMLGANMVDLAPQEVVEKVTSAPLGFAGPVGLKIPVYADSELAGGTDYVVGANCADSHLLHVDLLRDAHVERFADLRMITPEDGCPECGAEIHMTRGIEVGQVFKLGLKYSKSMHCTYLDENGKEQYMHMGSYGIGVSRVLAACIEQNYDDNGIIFPPAIAPFQCTVLNLDPSDANVSAKAEELQALLEKAGMDVLYDDRDERPGVKFKDADLIGCPMQFICGGRGIARGVVETKNRLTGEKGQIALDGLEAGVAAFRASVDAAWAERARSVH